MSLLTGPRALAAMMVVLLSSCGTGADSDRSTTAAANLPDWSGYWVVDGKVSEIDTDGYPHMNDVAKDWPMLGFSAPYNASGKAKFDSLVPRLSEYEAQAKTDVFGMPLMMEGPSPLQFVVTPTETLIINFHREIRHVYTDGRSHPGADDIWATTWGEAVGHWEDDTLVVETVAVRQPGPFNVPLPMLSEEARYTERIRRPSKDRIENTMTITDPSMLREPWVLQIAYERATHLDRMLHDEFFHNDRSSTSGDYFTIDPLPESTTTP